MTLDLKKISRKSTTKKSGLSLNETADQYQNHSWTLRGAKLSYAFINKTVILR